MGLKNPNVWGLYDMHGGTFEWCLDWSVDYRVTNPGRDLLIAPAGPATNGTTQYSGRITHGGCAYNNALLLRASFRQEFAESYEVPCARLSVPCRAVK